MEIYRAARGGEVFKMEGEQGWRDGVKKKIEGRRRDAAVKERW